MADAKKVSRIERGPGGADGVLVNYGEGSNPFFTPANMFLPDPRLAKEPIRTNTHNDQVAIEEALEKSTEGVVARMKANPGSFDLEYKSVKSPIMMASVNIKENKKKVEMLTPVASVLASNLDGNVCASYMNELKPVQINPNDHETLINKTNWELTLSCRSIDNPDTDGSQINPFNWSFLKFTEQLRAFEHNVIRMIAERLIKTYDDDEGECKFLPELVCSKEIRKAVVTGNVDALVDEIIKGPFVSVTRQAKLELDEQGQLKKKYKEKHGKWPAEEYVAENFTAVYGSDKITVKTKQFQHQMGKNAQPIDMTNYPPLARAVCESTPGTKWIKPIIQLANGDGELPYETTPVGMGDSVAVFFNPSFMVYKTNGNVKCGLTLQWTSELLYYRKKRAYVGSTARVVKKIKLSNCDSNAIQSAHEAAPTSVAPVELDLEEYN